MFKRFLGNQGSLFEDNGQLGIEKRVNDRLDPSFKHLNSHLKRVYDLRRRNFLFLGENFEGETSFIWNNNYKLKQWNEGE